ncbi:hypothetical protein ACNFJN_03215 [Xenorhabdus budapestensis]|uniref:hypothetical protein n=1 Tax=Xenorhabdus budapestensis TaxID=290110 RepID=UPI003A87720F
MRVRNINGTGDNTCSRCGSWLNHWKKHTKQNIETCFVLGCNKPAKEGAHVKKVGVNDNSWYILPFCHEHNMKHNEEFSTKILGALSLPLLVPASVSETCGK